MNFKSDGLELSPEVSELGGELLYCSFLWTCPQFHLPLDVRFFRVLASVRS